MARSDSSQNRPDTGESARPAHVPVLLKEVLQFLQLEPGLAVVDGTVGAAGHSREIGRRIAPSGLLIGLDRDALMLDIAAHQLSGLSSRLVQASYAELPQVLARLAVPAVDRILLDLGLSSDQLADESRGFSFSTAGPLDLRFDTTRGEPASELVARLGEQELAGISPRPLPALAAKFHRGRVIVREVGIPQRASFRRCGSQSIASSNSSRPRFTAGCISVLSRGASSSSSVSTRWKTASSNRLFENRCHGNSSARNR
jgi:hypothetical protein